MLPGTVLARKYRVDHVLGEGGMGIVLAARDLDLDRRVAIKVLRKDALAPGAVERFFREARAAAALDSEHVARVFEVGRTDVGEPYLVLERLEGTDLFERIGSGPPARVAEAARWIVEACEGLAGAHARGFVHRDLKPSNLFLARLPDGREIVKVLDFGLAKNPTDDESRITASGAILGSPGYASPEHLSGKGLDARSDVWSLGVTLYELLTRELPFRGATTPAICAAVLSADPAPIGWNRPEVPRELEAVILACLSKDPAGRPANVAELAARLEPFADGARGAAERIARTLAHAARGDVLVEVGERGVPTHLVSSVDASARDARVPRWLAFGLPLAFAFALVAFVIVRRDGRVAPEAPAPSAPGAPSASFEPPSEPTVALSLPTVTAIASAQPLRPKPRPRVKPRAQPSAAPDPLERF